MILLAKSNRFGIITFFNFGDSTEGYHDMYFGVCVGRKAGLTAKETFNAKNLQQIDEYLKERKKLAIAKA